MSRMGGPMGAPFGSSKGGGRGWLKPSAVFAWFCTDTFSPPPGTSSRVMEADGRDAGSRRADVSQLGSAAGAWAEAKTPPPFPIPPTLVTIPGAPHPPWILRRGGMRPWQGCSRRRSVRPAPWVCPSRSWGLWVPGWQRAIPPTPVCVWGGSCRGPCPPEHRTHQWSPRQQRRRRKESSY